MLQSKYVFIRGRVQITSSYSDGLACDVFYLFLATSSTISKKLQDDCETATTTLPPAAHFPDILSKQVEASNRSILTSQTQSLGDNTQVYNRGSLFWLKYHLRSAYLLKDIQQRRINSSFNATIIEV